MTSSANLLGRLYEVYASRHAGHGGDEAATLVYRRDIRPLLPRLAAGLVVEIGCGRGELVRSMQADGFDQTSFTARGIRQFATATSFDSILARSSPTVAHGLASAARVMVWQVVSAGYRIAVAAERGMLRDHIVTSNLTFAARKGAGPVDSAERSQV
jgi:hypothetical protein